LKKKGGAGGEDVRFCWASRKRKTIVDGSGDVAKKRGLPVAKRKPTRENPDLG